MQLSIVLAALSLGSLSLGSFAFPEVDRPVTVTGTTASADDAKSSAYRAPLAGGSRVLTPFHPPVARYGSGHLGVDLAARDGTVVLAAGPAVVRYAGAVAGRGVVVLLHADGISTEYEPVSARVAVGQRVTGGEVIARVHGTHRSCAPASCLHWGARRGAAYLDPLSLLRPLGVVRLMPWDEADR